MYMWIIMVPLLLTLVYLKNIISPQFFTFLAIIVLTGYSGILLNPEQYFLTFLTLVFSITMYRAGLCLPNTCKKGIWRALLYGVTIANLIILVYYIALVNLWIDIEMLFQYYEKDTLFGISRFSLGNAIEVPLLLSSLLFAALSKLSVNTQSLTAALINLIPAVIAESRLVLIIALLIFISQLFSSRIVIKIASMAIISFLIIRYSDSMVIVIESLINRFTGGDAGSLNDRQSIYLMIFNEINIHVLLIGNGLTSSASLMQQVTGEYRSIESLFLQLMYEIGLIGLTVFLFSIAKNIKNIFKIIPKDVVSLLILAQILFLMPVFNYLPYIFFSLGVASVKSYSLKSNSDYSKKEINTKDLTAGLE
jgi:hypothetical protein